MVVQPDANFECGFQSTAGVEVASADGCWISLSPNGYSGTATAYIVEPLVPGQPAVVSDKLTIQFDVAGSLAHMHMTFVSDTEGAPPEFAPANVPVLEENGQLQLVNNYFVDAAGNSILPPANITISVQSDVEGTVAVQPIAWQNLKALYR